MCWGEYQVGAGEEGGVGALGVVRGGVVVECVFAEFFVVEEFVDFVDVLPDFGDVEGSEIFEESFVDQVLDGVGGTLSMLKKKALGMSLGGATSAR